MSAAEREAARAAADAEAQKQHEASMAEAKEREELRALAEQLAQKAKRADKAAAADEILHALTRSF